MSDKKEPTLGERLRKIATQKSDEALNLVDGWHDQCIARMENVASTRKNSAEVEVRTVEAGQCPHADFVDEFTAAAEALKAKLEADGSVKATYVFKETREETIDGGMEQSWRDVRHYPACHKLIFNIRW
jgi:hypothetical protein